MPHLGDRVLGRSDKYHKPKRADRSILTWRGQAPFGGWNLPASAATGTAFDDPAATAQAACHAPASEAVTAVTDYFSSSPLFFGRRVIDVQSVKTSAAHDHLVQKIALTAIVDQAHNSKRGRSCADPRTNRRLGRGYFVGSLSRRRSSARKMSTTLRSKPAMRNRRALPSRQRTYRRLHVRVDRLEDAISHFYNVINELRRRVSTLEKKLKPLAKDDRTN